MKSGEWTPIKINFWRIRPMFVMYQHVNTVYLARVRGVIIHYVNMYFVYMRLTFYLTFNVFLLLFSGARPLYQRTLYFYFYFYFKSIFVFVLGSSGQNQRRLRYVDLNAWIVEEFSTTNRGKLWLKVLLPLIYWFLMDKNSNNSLNSTPIIAKI